MKALGAMPDCLIHVPSISAADAGNARKNNMAIYLKMFIPSPLIYMNVFCHANHAKAELADISLNYSYLTRFRTNFVFSVPIVSVK